MYTNEEEVMREILSELKEIKQLVQKLVDGPSQVIDTAVKFGDAGKNALIKIERVLDEKFKDKDWGGEV